MVKEVLAKGKTHRTDEYQGFYLDVEKQKTVGYITALKIRDTEYLKNIVFTNPMDIEGEKLKVVGVLAAIKFSGDGLPIIMTFQIGARNKSLVARQMYKQEVGLLKDSPLEVRFALYQYDSEKKKYYKSLHSGAVALKGSIESDQEILELELNSEPSEVVPPPQSPSA